MKLEFSRQTFKKYSNIKFHEYPSSESWVVSMRKDMTKLPVAFRNFANAPKNEMLFSSVKYSQRPLSLWAAEGNEVRETFS
jgi:hypothetical protein